MLTLLVALTVQAARGDVPAWVSVVSIAVALVGFGADSLIEAAAGLVVLWLLTGAGVLFVAQALLGAANVWLELATSVRIAHLALASAVWAVLVFTMAWAYQNGLRLTKGIS